jgi:RNA polymerase sigma-70 factor (ECF subfamily)
MTRGGYEITPEECVMPSTSPSDVQSSHVEELKLAQRAAAGEREAQREVVLALMDRVRNTTVYLVGRTPDADDMAQVALMEVLRSLSNYSGRGSLSAWSNRIVVRSVYAQLRKRAARQARRAALAADARAEPLHADATVSLAGDRRRRRITELLNELSEQKRMAVVLKLVHGYSVQEISEMIEVPFETVRSRLRHGRRELMEKVRSDPELASAMEAWR